MRRTGHHFEIVRVMSGKFLRVKSHYPVLGFRFLCLCDDDGVTAMMLLYHGYGKSRG